MNKPVVALIPSRLASRRLPGKALLNICGLPMIVHVAKRTQLSSLVDEVYVCTDSDQIHSVCVKHNIPVLLTSSEHTNGTERIASVAGRFPGSVIIDVQGDEPLIQPDNIDTVVEFTMNCEFIPEIVLPSIPSLYDSADSVIRVLSSISGRVMYLSRSSLPFPFKSRPQFMNKHLSTICFSPGSLERYISFPRSYFESIEDIELLRAIENDMSVFSLQISGNSHSVDILDDVAKVEFAMTNDSLLHQYI